MRSRDSNGKQKNWRKFSVLEPSVKGEPNLRGHTFIYVIFYQLRNSQDVRFWEAKYVWKMIRAETKRVKKVIKMQTRPI